MDRNQTSVELAGVNLWFFASRCHARSSIVSRLPMLRSLKLTLRSLKLTLRYTVHGRQKFRRPQEPRRFISLR